MVDNSLSGKLFWLASYPKSGNTWTRIFLANLLNENNKCVDINSIDTGAIASSRDWVQAALGFNINELNNDEVDQLRPQAYRWLSSKANDYEFHKTHDAFSYSNDGYPLFPLAATQGALVIARNPLDVVVSFSFHNNESIDRTITRLNDKHSVLCGKNDRLQKQLRQQLYSWSGFYQSWLDAEAPKYIVRYEDMHANPMVTFSRISRFLKIEAPDTEIERAIASSTMSELQEQEGQSSFREKSPKAERFFRKGAVDDWKNYLSNNQVERIIECHAEMMQKLGYLNSKYQPEVVGFEFRESFE